MSLRIGYLVPQFPGQTHAFFWREISALEEAGLEVHLVSTRAPAASDVQHAFFAAAKIRTRYVFPPRLSSLVAARRMAGVRFSPALGYVAALREASMAERLRLAAMLPCASELAIFARAHALDHLHVHSFANSAHLAAMARLLGGAPYSLTLHGDLPVYGRDHAAKIRHAAYLTAVTQDLATQIAEVAPERTADVITMGVDTDRFAPLPGQARTSDTPLRLVTVARLNGSKGHLDLLDALATLREHGLAVHWTIVGEGPHRPSIEARVAELGLSGSVTLLGGVGENRVLKVLRAADAFVLPSYGRGEAAPVSLMEAMSCGLAVIATRIGATPQMIDDGTTGLLVAQRDVAGLAAAIEVYANSADTRARLGEAARQHAIRAFGYRAQAARLADGIRASLAAR